MASKKEKRVIDVALGPKERLLIVNPAAKDSVEEYNIKLNKALSPVIRDMIDEGYTLFDIGTFINAFVLSLAPSLQFQHTHKAVTDDLFGTSDPNKLPIWLGGKLTNQEHFDLQIKDTVPIRKTKGKKR